MRILLVPSADIDAFEQMGYKTYERCRAAFKLWQSGEYDRVLLTGGMCRPSRIQEVPDAEIMRRYLCHKGVPEDAILIEDEARDTFQNVAFSLQLLLVKGIWSKQTEITVVSTKQHCRRFRVTFWRCYKIKICEHHVNYYQPLRERMAEMLFYIVHLVDPRGTSFIAKWNRKKRTFSQSAR